MANSTGSNNSAFGSEAFISNVTGDNNTAIGAETGSKNLTGNSITLVGGQSNVTIDGLQNATAIGAFSTVGASNSMILGGTGTNAVNVGIGTTTPHSNLEISSAGATTLTLTTTTPSILELDFDTAATSASGAPTAAITANETGTGSAELLFLAINPSAPTSGLQPTMTIDPIGDVNVIGNLHVSGTLSKAAGSFKIDDPIAPAEKYLSHSFVESPDMMNIYNGNVVTDANGFASVELPAWFEALNGDFRYQLTPMGQFAQAMVAAEIKDGSFTIRTDKPNVKISWQVTGVRHDAYANAHRIPTEELKPANEQGHYLHPELFGAGPEKSINAVNRSHSDVAPAAGSESSAQSAGGSQ